MYMQATSAGPRLRRLAFGSGAALLLLLLVASVTSSSSRRPHSMFFGLSSSFCSATPSKVSSPLRWAEPSTANDRAATADRICCRNHDYAEWSGSWTASSFPKRLAAGETITFYDVASHLPLYRAPIGRTFDEFFEESGAHGWPSFRDQEVIWENVVVKSGGEVVSGTGTHLGHNLPDRKGNRHCINLVCVSGPPPK